MGDNPNIGYSYRGLFWKLDRDHGQQAAFAFISVLAEPELGIVCLYPPSVRTPRAAMARWREAFDREATSLDHFYSCDGIPWEIHAIDDEDAYQAALRAYVEALDAP